jgi:hypothetical protein
VVDPRCGTSSSVKTATSSAELGRCEQLLDVLLLFNFLSVKLQEEPAFANYEQLTVLLALILQPPDLYTVRIKAVRIR